MEGGERGPQNTIGTKKKLRGHASKCIFSSGQYPNHEKLHNMEYMKK
jgi:hypothetical protein